MDQKMRPINLKMENVNIKFFFKSIFIDNQMSMDNVSDEEEYVPSVALEPTGLQTPL